jgi:hypothetical protein
MLNQDMDNFTFFRTHQLKGTPAHNKPELTNKHLMDEIVVAAEKDRNSTLSVQQIRFCYGKIMKTS